MNFTNFFSAFNMFAFALRRSVSVSGIFMLFISAACAQGENLAGHYYLSGVTEVGSELLLKRDGSFEWAMSYGAMDQQSQGTWKLRDGKLVLTSKALKARRPFLSLKGVEPWSDDAASQLKYLQESARDDKAHAFCPFLYRQIAVAGGKPKQQAEPADAGATAAAMSYDTDLAAANKAGKIAVAKLPAELSAFHALRIKTKAEINAFQAETQDSESWAQASNTLMAKLKSYRGAEDALRKMIVQAIAIDDKYRDLFDIDDLHPTIWQYATYSCSRTVQAKIKEPNVAYVAIYVDDPENGVRIAKNSKAQVKYADGSVQNMTRFDSGYVMATLQAGQSITGIGIDTIESENDPIKHFDFAVKVDRQSVIRVLMDVTSLIPIPFETLALPIKGNGLIFQGGVYKKQ
ncbi:hypothetical protein [Undibacterium parvum]|uniref:Uncharacterized protein n=1 Tax=Undibacterium parvum TaxID=401471 RepID=A0A3S9HPV0_9BURK|nr:hypothetical protein [Undibacterium parvum]AZP14146.1 hypothetical protein EJN92_20370 [Undibacterium parvum]